MLCTALLAAGAASAAASRQMGPRDLAARPGYSFDDYVKDFGKQYVDESEHATRAAAFAANLAKVRAHNAGSATWSMGMNEYSDLSPVEFKQRYLGLNKAQLWQHRARVTEGAVNITTHRLSGAAPPASIDWREKGVVTAGKDQKSCGSCWAFSSTETIESALAIATGTLLEVSEQQIVSCSTNPDQCGGTGGCAGSIQPLAFQYVVDNGGIAYEGDYPYTSGSGQTGTCDKSKTGKSLVSISGHKELKTNDYNSLIDAVVNVGPIAISVGASPFQQYHSGVMTCGKMGSDIDHAVQLVGYGSDNGKDYWLVRNSWGAYWGEKGYIRVARHGDGQEPCYTDNKPGDGFGCKGGPSSIQVCGECGLLSASSYPTGAKLLHNPPPATPAPPPCPLTHCDTTKCISWCKDNGHGHMTGCNSNQGHGSCNCQDGSGCGF